MRDLENCKHYSFRFWIGSFLVLSFGRSTGGLKKEERDWFSAQLADGLNYVPLAVRADKDALGPYLVIEGVRFDPRTEDFRVPLLKYILRLYEEIKQFRDPELLRLAKRKLWQLFSVNDLDLVLDDSVTLKDIKSLLEKEDNLIQTKAVLGKSQRTKSQSVDCGENKTCLATVAGLAGAGGGSVLVNVVNKGQMVSTPFLILLIFIALVLILLLVCGLYLLITRRNKSQLEYQLVSQVDEKVKTSGGSPPSSLERGNSSGEDRKLVRSKSMLSKLTEKLVPNGPKSKVHPYKSREAAESVTSEEDKAFLAQSERTSTPSVMSVNSEVSLEAVPKDPTAEFQGNNKFVGVETIPKVLDTSPPIQTFQRQPVQSSDLGVRKEQPVKSLAGNRHEGIVWSRFGHEMTPRTSPAIIEHVIRQPRAESSRRNSHPRHKHEEAEHVTESHGSRKVEETRKTVTTTTDEVKEFQIPKQVSSRTNLVTVDMKENDSFPDRTSHLKLSSPFRKSLQNLLKRSTATSSPVRPSKANKGGQGSTKRTSRHDAEPRTHVHSQTIG